MRRLGLKEKKKKGIFCQSHLTEVIQSQISFLSALGRILNFLQAESKVGLEAHWHLQSCADPTPAPEAACHFPRCH